MKSNSHSPPRHRGNYGKWNIHRVTFTFAAVFGAALVAGFGAQLAGIVPEITWSPIVAKAFVAGGMVLFVAGAVGLYDSHSAPPSRKERRVDKGTVGADNRRTKTDIGAMMKKILDSISAGVRRHRLYDGGLAGSTGYAVAAA